MESDGKVNTKDSINSGARTCRRGVLNFQSSFSLLRYFWYESSLGRATSPGKDFSRRSDIWVVLRNRFIGSQVRQLIISSLRISGISGLHTLGGEGYCSQCWISYSPKEEALNGGAPVSIS